MDSEAVRDMTVIIDGETHTASVSVRTEPAQGTGHIRFRIPGQKTRTIELPLNPNRTEAQSLLDLERAVKALSGEVLDFDVAGPFSTEEESNA